MKFNAITLLGGLFEFQLQRIPRLVDTERRRYSKQSTKKHCRRPETRYANYKTKDVLK